MRYTFLDTGILDELLEIPTYSNKEKSTEIKKEFEARCRNGERMIIPFAAMIEVGNHIAQIKSSDTERQRCANQFAEFLKDSSNSKAPWTLCMDGLTNEQIVFISEKFGEVGAEMKIGTGDVSIVYQYEKFCERLSGIAEDIYIWSLDHHIPNLQKKLGKSFGQKRVVRRRRDK